MTSDMKKLQEENARLMNLVERDGLTGLYNRKTIEEKINRLLLLHQESFMIALDVDKFKLVNDELGHLAGDYVLQSIARVLKEVFRSEDMIGRIGGDEYLVFLPNLGKQDIVIRRMTQMNEMMAKFRLQDGRTYPVQVSYGYSCYQKGDTYKTLFDRADQMLLERKRNRLPVRMTNIGGPAVIGKRQINTDIKIIREDLRETGKVHGAYYQPYDQFKCLFRFLERSIHRLGKSSNIILMTLSDYQDEFIPLRVRGNHMRSLASAISESLRMNDVYCQYSSSQYLLMIVGADCSDTERIVRRISDRFYEKIKMDSTQRVCLDHTVYPLSAIDEKFSRSFATSSSEG